MRPVAGSVMVSSNSAMPIPPIGAADDLAAGGLLVEDAAAVDGRHHPRDADEAEIFVDADFDELARRRHPRAPCPAARRRGGTAAVGGQLRKAVPREDVGVALPARGVVAAVRSGRRRRVRLPARNRAAATRDRRRDQVEEPAEQRVDRVVRGRGEPPVRPEPPACGARACRSRRGRSGLGRAAGPAVRAESCVITVYSAGADVGRGAAHVGLRRPRLMVARAWQGTWNQA